MKSIFVPSEASMFHLKAKGSVLDMPIARKKTTKSNKNILIFSQKLYFYFFFNSDIWFPDKIWNTSRERGGMTRLCGLYYFVFVCVFNSLFFM